MDIVTSLRSELAKHSIELVRADQKQYHDDLFWNILTCIYGCSFGIAVFERIELEEFNPNIALEVGYIMALQKPVLLLKDRTLKNLNTDLIGKLYRTFDPQTIPESIGPEVRQWLKDKGIIKSEKEQQREALAFTDFVIDPYWNSLARASGTSLDQMFTIITESKSLDEFLLRCFPFIESRNVFLKALKQGNEKHEFIERANVVRRRIAVQRNILFEPL
jgi:hypothetical protein